MTLMTTHAPTPIWLAAATAPPTIGPDGNCTLCGEHPTMHVRNGEIASLREAHRPALPTGVWLDEVA